MTAVGIVVTLLVFVVGLAALFVVERRFSSSEQRILWLAFASHVVAALGVVWVTQEVLGGGDLLDYQAHALRVTNALRADFWGLIPDVVRVIFHAQIPLPVPILGEGTSTGSMIALSSLVFLLLGDSIYSACLAVSILCFFSRVAIYSAFKQALGLEESRGVAVACLLIPSVTFWCSGLLKETLALTGIGALFWAVQRLASKGGSAIAWLVGGSGLALAGAVKSYLLIPFGLGLGVWFFLSQARGRALLRSAWGLLGGVAIAIAAVVIGGAIFPRYALATLTEQTMHMQQVGQRSVRDASVVLIDPVVLGEEGLGAQLPFLPLALVTALFRPFLFEVANAQMLVNALETAVFAFLFVLALIRNRIRRNFETLTRNPVLGLCAGFVLVGALGVGITTTNLGALSRYRAPFMPFFAVMLVVMSQRARGRVPNPGRRFSGFQLRMGPSPRALR